MDICWLSGGNGHEHTFPLSVHTARMLLQGIREYSAFADWMYEQGIEDACYCRLPAGTAIDVGLQLRGWVVAVAPRMGDGFLEEVDEVLRELSLQRQRFATLAIAENEEYEREHGKCTSHITWDEFFAAVEKAAEEQRTKRGLE